jgi:hypothetical protein
VSGMLLGPIADLRASIMSSYDTALLITTRGCSQFCHPHNMAPIVSAIARLYGM